MECKGQESKSMVYSRDGEVSSGIGTEKAGAGQQAGLGWRGGQEAESTGMAVPIQNLGIRA